MKTIDKYIEERETKYLNIEVNVPLLKDASDIQFKNTRDKQFKNTRDKQFKNTRDKQLNTMVKKMVEKLQVQ